MDTFFRYIALFGMLSTALHAQHVDVVVDQNGGGDFKTISEALGTASSYNYQRKVIYIKNGVYEEKVRISQHYITLRGESRDSTIIQFDAPREDWIKNKDYIGPAVINIHADDVILDNLTIENTQPEIGPHAFAIYGTGTRTVITNCNVLSKGGDTVSLWNYKHGMYYHADCFFQGAVDFVCPRGWCFIRDSKFYEVKKTAALWHAGFYDPDQKFVLRNCEFDGVEGFSLGRHHYQAQFYLLDCQFPESMEDRPIYLSAYDDPARNNPYYLGDRTYFHNCEKEGEPYDWYRNNLSTAKGSPAPADITPKWTFDGEWDPENTEPIKVTNAIIIGKRMDLVFDELVTMRNEPVIVTPTGKEVRLVKMRFNDINRFRFIGESALEKKDLQGTFQLKQGDIVASKAYASDRSVGQIFSCAE